MVGRGGFRVLGVVVSAVVLSGVLVSSVGAQAQDEVALLEAPEGVGGAVWSAAVRVGEGSAGGAVFGYSRWTGVGDATIGEITSVRFSFEGVRNEVHYVGYLPSDNKLYFGLARRIDSEELALRVGGRQFALGDAEVTRFASWNYTWEATGIDWAAGDIVNAHLLVPPPADPATLGGLGLDGLPEMDFDPGRSRYDVEHSPGAVTATVDAEGATDDTGVDVLVVRTDGDLGFDGTDADPNTDGHQALLSATGQTLIIVKSDDGTRERAYIVRTTPAENAGGAESQQTAKTKSTVRNQRFARSSVGRSTDSSDATLASLALVGAALDPEFAADIHTYRADAASDTTQVTVTAEPNTAGAEVAITPADADADTDGHQVNLLTPQPGGDATETTIGVAVESTNNNVLFLYQITVTRAAPPQTTRPPAFARNPKLDLRTSDRYATTDIWSDGETWYVASSTRGPEAILAFDFDTGARKTAKDMRNLDTQHFNSVEQEGIWSDGEVMYSVDMYQFRLHAYSMDEDTYGDGLEGSSMHLGKRFRSLARYCGYQYLCPDEEARGIWSDGETAWVASILDGVLYAFDLDTKERVYSKDFTRMGEAGNSAPVGVWSDGTTVWVSDREDAKIYAYDMATKVRRPELEFNTLDAAGNDSPAGLWSNGTTMWVADYEDDRAYAYNMPSLRRLASVEVSGVDLGRRSQHEYAGSVARDVDVVTVSAEPAMADHTVMFGTADADLDEEGHQWNLAAGDNTMAVAVSDGADTTQHTVTVRKLDVLEVDDEVSLSGIELSGIELDGFTSDTLEYTAKAVDLDMTTVTATPTDQSADVEIHTIDADTQATGHQAILRPGLRPDVYGPVSGHTIRITVRSWDRTAERTYTVEVRRGTTADYGWVAHKDLPFSHDLWSDGTTMWVSPSGQKRLLAYDSETGARKSDQDFNTQDTPGHPDKLWSDGDTMWISKTNRSQLYAYDMQTKARKPERDFHLGWGSIQGIWSDGITMWVNRESDSKMYAYDLKTKARKPEQEFNEFRLVYPGLDDMWSDGVTMWFANHNYYRNNLYAVDLETKRRVPSKDFTTLFAANNRNPEALWSDGTTMWVTDERASKVFAYNMPKFPRLEVFEVSGADIPRLSMRRYVGTVDNAVTTLTVTAQAAHSDHPVTFDVADADADADGHQWDLAVGENALAVSVSDGTETVVYTVTVTRADS